MRNKSSISIAIGALANFLSGCDRLPVPIGGDGSCGEVTGAPLTFQELFEGYSGEPLPLPPGSKVSAVVGSSDEAGNFYQELFLLEADGQSAFRLLVDLRDTHAHYPLGLAVSLRTDGLVLDRKDGIYQIGLASGMPDDPRATQIPGPVIGDFLVPSCGNPGRAPTSTMTAAELVQEPLGIRVTVLGVQVSEGYRATPFALPEEDILLPFEDCDGYGLSLWNSGYADFRDAIVPDSLLDATGILVATDRGPALRIDNPDGLVPTGPRCNRVDPGTGTSPSVFISEIADPDNEPSARFLELYHPGPEPIELNGWSLVRYTNGNTEPGSTTPLDGLTIAPGGTLVFASDSLEFQRVFGFVPDVEAGGNSVADSNGDDNILLYGPDGDLRDIFGKIGEDGTGTDHEFEDGKAERIPGITAGSSVFRPLEWVVFNDSGAGRTEARPQSAPTDFSPGRHG